MRFETALSAYACRCYADLDVSEMLKETTQSCMTRFMFAYYAESKLMIHGPCDKIHRDSNRTL